MTDLEKEQRYWELTRGKEWISVFLPEERVVYIHNFKLDYIFDVLGFSEYMTYCAIPSYKDKPIPKEWSELEKEKLNNEIVLSYAAFLHKFVKCDSVQYDQSNKLFRIVNGKNYEVLNDKDMGAIFEAFKEVYCLSGSKDNVPWKDAKPRNKEDEEFLAIMRKAKAKIDEKKNGKHTIDSIILGVTSKHQSYNMFNIWGLTMWQLMETHSKMYGIDNAYFTKIGIYTGNIDTKKAKIEANELGWSTRD